MKTETTQSDDNQHAAFVNDIKVKIKQGLFDLAIQKCDFLLKLNQTNKAIKKLKAHALQGRNDKESYKLAIQIYNALIKQDPEDSSLLRSKYMCLLRFQNACPNLHDKIQHRIFKTFNKLVHATKDDAWMQLADYLLKRKMLSLEEQKIKLSHICNKHPDNLVALYFYAISQKNSSPTSYQKNYISNAGLLDGGDDALAFKYIQDAIMAKEINNLNAVAEYYKPQKLTAIRNMVNVDRFFQNSQAISNQVLALMCLDEYQQAHNISLLAYRWMKRQPECLSAHVFYLLALSSKRPLDLSEIRDIFATAASKFNKNIFLMTFQHELTRRCELVVNEVSKHSPTQNRKQTILAEQNKEILLHTLKQQKKKLESLEEGGADYKKTQTNIAMLETALRIDNNSSVNTNHFHAPQASQNNPNGCVCF